MIIQIIELNGMVIRQHSIESVANVENMKMTALNMTVKTNIIIM